MWSRVQVGKSRLNEILFHHFFLILPILRGFCRHGGKSESQLENDETFSGLCVCLIGNKGPSYPGEIQFQKRSGTRPSARPIEKQAKGHSPSQLGSNEAQSNKEERRKGKEGRFDTANEENKGRGDITYFVPSWSAATDGKTNPKNIFAHHNKQIMSN